MGRKKVILAIKSLYVSSVSVAVKLSQMFFVQRCQEKEEGEKKDKTKPKAHLHKPFKSNKILSF